jgi:hypothetical protein
VGSPEISVLDYKSQQEKLIPMLASAYALHFTSRYLVQQYCEMKRTKEDDIIAEVHSLSAGAPPHHGGLGADIGSWPLCKVNNAWTKIYLPPGGDTYIVVNWKCVPKQQLLIHYINRSELTE